MLCSTVYNVTIRFHKCGLECDQFPLAIQQIPYSVVTEDVTVTIDCHVVPELAGYDIIVGRPDLDRMELIDRVYKPEAFLCPLGTHTDILPQVGNVVRSPGWLATTPTKAKVTSVHRGTDATYGWTGEEEESVLRMAELGPVSGDVRRNTATNAVQATSNVAPTLRARCAVGEMESLKSPGPSSGAVHSGFNRQGDNGAPSVDGIVERESRLPWEFRKKAEDPEVWGMDPGDDGLEPWDRETFEVHKSLVKRYVSEKTREELIDGYEKEGRI